MKHPKLWAHLFLIASIVTATLIFWFSAQKGVDSQALSDPLTLRVAGIVRPDFMQLPESDRIIFLDLLSTVIRKNAHFCEYALLGFCLMGTFRFYLPKLTDGGCRRRTMAIAVPYAISDELHQLLVSERAGRVTDVLIDSAGSLTGTFVLTLCLILFTKLLQRHKAR